MKKKLACLLTAILALSAVPAYAGVPAAPNASEVLVNGASKAFEAYTINDSNYFKLRDIAYALNNTAATFSVGWDSAANCILVATGESYAPTGTEMQVSGTKDIKDAVESTSAILIDGSKATLTAYTINGSNYFKLRDLGTALGFDVGWDSEAKTIAITSADFMGGYGGPGEDYVPEESETPAEISYEQAAAMDFYFRHFQTCMYPTESTTIMAIPKTSEIADIQIDHFYLNGVKGVGTVVKLPAGDASFFGDDTVNEFCVKYFFPKDILNHPAFSEGNDLATDYIITTKDGKTYTYCERIEFPNDGYGGDSSWGDDLLSAEIIAQRDALWAKDYSNAYEF